jgi:hypothetical protein
MFKDRELRKHIGLAIIAAAVIPYLVDPALRWFAHSLIWLSENVSTAFTKSIYRKAAVGFHEQYSFEMLGLAGYVLAVVIIMIPLTMYVIKRSKEELDRQSEMEYLGNEEIREESKLEAVMRVADRVIFPLSCVTAVLAVSIGLIIVTSDYIELQLNASFNQRMTVLALYATDQQVKEMRAEWALMLDRQDYERINAEMDIVSKKLGFKLPKTLWP